jgi:hypothetical protein
MSRDGGCSEEKLLTLDRSRMQEALAAADVHRQDRAHFAGGESRRASKDARDVRARESLRPPHGLEAASYSLSHQHGIRRPPSTRLRRRRALRATTVRATSSLLTHAVPLPSHT